MRLAALEAGKTLLMAVPRLAGEAPLLLDGRALTDAQRRRAADRQAMTRLAAPVRCEAISCVDLIISGCVGVTREGARLGKGGGYADLEFALLAALGVIDLDVPVLRTVHPAQLLERDAVRRERCDVRSTRCSLRSSTSSAPEGGRALALSTRGCSRTNACPPAARPVAGILARGRDRDRVDP